MDHGAYTIRLSRPFLLLILAVGVLFLLAGLDLAVFRAVLAPAQGPGSPVTIAFAAFCILIGAVIAVSQAYYLLAPPVMLAITRDAVTFGTGLRYRPFSIPARYLTGVDVYRRESMVEFMERGRQQVVGGVELRFQEAPDVPAGMATSAGIEYGAYTLRLHRAYMNVRPEAAAEALQAYLPRSRNWTGRPRG